MEEWYNPEAVRNIDISIDLWYPPIGNYLLIEILLYSIFVYGNGDIITM